MSSAASSGDSAVTVIGAGIVGLASALALQDRRPELPILVIDKEPRLGAHQSGHNSGVIHSGIYYPPGSAKSRLVAAGRDLMLRWCEEHGIPHRVDGKVVVATHESELPALAALEDRAGAAGIATNRLSPPELSAREPHVRAIAALEVPSTATVDFGSVVESMAQEFTERGGELSLGTPWTAGRGAQRGMILNCAGLWSDRVAEACGADIDMHIVGFRGEYHSLTPEAAPMIRAAVYPVPDPRFPFLGVHFTRGVDDHVHLGPNAVLAGGREAYDGATWRELAATLGDPAVRHLAVANWRSGLGELARSRSKRLLLRRARRMLPELEIGHLQAAAPGIRAQAVRNNGTLIDDFEFAESPGAVHVLNAPSPAATASLAIGQHVAERLLQTL